MKIQNLAEHLQSKKEAFDLEIMSIINSELKMSDEVVALKNIVDITKIYVLHDTDGYQDSEGAESFIRSPYENLIHRDLLGFDKQYFDEMMVESPVDANLYLDEFIEYYVYTDDSIFCATEKDTSYYKWEKQPDFDEVKLLMRLSATKLEQFTQLYNSIVDELSNSIIDISDKGETLVFEI